MRTTIEKNYTTPKLEIVNIEADQCILTASTENVGNRNEDLDW